MATTAVATNGNGPGLGTIDDQTMWRLVASGDLTGLTDAQKSRYYLHLCDTLGINPATAPFEYMRLNNKLVLYAKRTATDQLRTIKRVSLVGKPTIVDDGEYITAEVTVQDATGRTDYDIGCVFVGTAKGEPRANARMKALTKAKRRATLSICGLGMLDESEVDSVPGAVRLPYDPAPNPAPAAQIATVVAANGLDGESTPAYDATPKDGEAVDAEALPLDRVPDKNDPADAALWKARHEALSRAVSLRGKAGLGNPDAYYDAAESWVHERDRNKWTLGMARTVLGNLEALVRQREADQALAAEVDAGSGRGIDGTPANGNGRKRNRYAGLHKAVIERAAVDGQELDGETAHKIAHDLAVAGHGVASLSELDDADLAGLTARVNDMAAGELEAAWEAAAKIADAQPTSTNRPAESGDGTLPGMPADAVTGEPGNDKYSY